MSKAMRFGGRPVLTPCFRVVARSRSRVQLRATNDIHSDACHLHGQHRSVSGLGKRSTFASQQQRRGLANTSDLRESSNEALRDDTAPNAPKSPLTIVFTDIVKSSAIWEKDPAAMSEAMTIHDDLLRALMDKHTGYEVKQNGDGFMIVFQSATSALNYCLDVQVQLQNQEWPSGLLEMKAARPVVEAAEDSEDVAKDEVVLWSGLRLRLSAHFGEPVCKYNEVIDRMDYLGPVVNRAARFVSVCEGGQIVVSEEFLTELMQISEGSGGNKGPLYKGSEATLPTNERFDLTILESEEVQKVLSETQFEIRMLGDRHFKGVPEQRRLYFIVPKSLHGRLDYFPKHEYVQASKGNLVGTEA